MPAVSSNAEDAANAMQEAEVETFALEGTKEVSIVVAHAGQLNLARRDGGGKYKRSVASVFDAPVGSEGWAAVLQTPWMGMEFGGWITNVYGARMGSTYSSELGLKPMWAPHHNDYAQGYILGAAWVKLGKGEASAKMADRVLLAYVKAFDKAGLRRV